MSFDTEDKIKILCNVFIFFILVFVIQKWYFCLFSLSFVKSEKKI